MVPASPINRVIVQWRHLDKTQCFAASYQPHLKSPDQNTKQFETLLYIGVAVQWAENHGWLDPASSSRG